MYEEYWRLSGRPFENRTTEGSYYPAETHQAAILKLRYAIENRRAAALLCGPSGMGKSMVVNLLAQQLEDNYRPLHQIVFPALSSEQLVRYMAEQLDSSACGLPRESSSDLIRLEKFLTGNVESGKHAVVFVDEAHLLEQYGLLEPLRLLLNLAAAQGPGESAWTLVLVGQPTLLAHVERYHPLDERLAVKCLLNRLLPEETHAYIQHRIRAVGADAQSLFDEEAVDRIHQLSQGIPRRINRLGDLALMVGFAEERNVITGAVIDNVYGDLTTPIVG
jgi:general secretion pathway protein A